jgi:nucleoside-triphosphatase
VSARAVSKPGRFILWTGPKHSGKTTAAGDLARQARREGRGVAGLLAPAVHESGRLAGFDAIDLRTGERVSPASRRAESGGCEGLRFTAEGRKLGKAALSVSAAGRADLVIVDEFGPLELRGQGWRKDVDLLLAGTDSVVLLVVREELVEQVERLYADYQGRILAAGGKDSIGQVIDMLKGRRLARQQNDKA